MFIIWADIRKKFLKHKDLLEKKKKSLVLHHFKATVFKGA